MKIEQGRPPNKLLPKKDFEKIVKQLGCSQLKGSSDMYRKLKNGIVKGGGGGGDTLI